MEEERREIDREGNSKKDLSEDLTGSKFTVSQENYSNILNKI